MTVSVYRFVAYMRAIIRKKDAAESWLSNKLLPFETHEIKTIRQGLGLLISIRSFRGDKILAALRATDVGHQMEMLNLKLENGVWSAVFIFSVPFEDRVPGCVRQQENFKELEIQLDAIEGWNKGVEGGFFLEDIARQHIEVCLQQVEYCVNHL
jgi:hypothetical protein